MKTIKAIRTSEAFEIGITTATCKIKIKDVETKAIINFDKELQNVVVVIDETIPQLLSGLGFVIDSTELKNDFKDYYNNREQREKEKREKEVTAKYNNSSIHKVIENLRKIAPKGIKVEPGILLAEVLGGTWWDGKIPIYVKKESLNKKMVIRYSGDVWSSDVRNRTKTNVPWILEGQRNTRYATPEKAFLSAIKKIEESIEEADKKKKQIEEKEAKKAKILKQIGKDFPEFEVKFEEQWHRDIYRSHGGGGYTTNEYHIVVKDKLVNLRLNEDKTYDFSIFSNLHPIEIKAILTIGFKLENKVAEKKQVEREEAFEVALAKDKITNKKKIDLAKKSYQELSKMLKEQKNKSFIGLTKLQIVSELLK